jgi:hypothetical protein
MRGGARDGEEGFVGLGSGRAKVEPEAPDRARREKGEHADDEGDELRADRPAHGRGRRPPGMSIVHLDV